MCCIGDVRADSRAFHEPSRDLRSSPWLRVNAHLNTISEATERIRGFAETDWAAREAMRNDNSGYLKPDGTLVKDVRVNPHLVNELAI